MLQGFFQLNTLPVGIIIYMIIMVSVNRNYEPEITKRFKIPIFMLLALIIDDNVDYYLFETGSISIVHVVTALVGYNLRINILVAMMFIILRNDCDRRKYLLIIPATICLILSSLALFTDMVFWYDPVDGHICRGPLAYVPHMTSVIYMAVLVYEGWKCIRKEKVEEGLIIVIGCILNAISIAVEMLFALRGILMGTIALIIVFYYLYIHTQYFKTDILTGALNRISFRADGDRYKGRIRGLMMIDLNNLKMINDTCGHEEGDTALKTLAYRVGRCLPQGCYLYRTGGDEFAVMCTLASEPDLPEIKRSIKREMENTKYRWAVGYAEFLEPEEEFSKVLRRADAEMYKDKTAMKGGTP